MSELVFDLVGPFVVQFREGEGDNSGTAYIYAPLCDKHHANILTDSDDVFVPGSGDSSRAKYVYRFVNSTAPKGAPRYKFVDGVHEKLLLLVPFNGEPLVGESDTCHLVLEIPCPDYIIPLHAERIWIHKNTAITCWVTSEDRKDTVDSNRARALRFIYKECSKMPVIDVPEVYRGKAFSSQTLGVSGVPHYNMTFRFAEAGERSSGQADAYSCFHKSRAMWSPSRTGCDLSDWRVDFDDLRHFNKEGGGASPRDCHAAIIIMQNWK